MARPQKVTDDELIDGAYEYMENAEIPILAEFALQMGLSSNRLYERAQENEELSSAIKKIIDLKQVVLEKGALKGELNSTMAIFSLKQTGWRDRFETEQDIKQEIKVSIKEDISEYAD